MDILGTLDSFSPLIVLVLVITVARIMRRRFEWISVPATSIYVIDGDTFSVLLTSGDRVNVRPIRYDAPELDQKGGKMATAYLRQLAKQGFYVREIEADLYGRTIAEVRIGENGKGGDLADHMMRVGLAHSVADTALFRFLETLVPRLLGRGIWKNSWLGLTVTHPQIHRGAKRWAMRYRGY